MLNRGMDFGGAFERCFFLCRYCENKSQRFRFERLDCGSFDSDEIRLDIVSPIVVAEIVLILIRVISCTRARSSGSHASALGECGADHQELNDDDGRCCDERFHLYSSIDSDFFTVDA